MNRIWYMCVCFYLWLLDNNLHFAEMKMKMYLIVMAEIIKINPSFHLLNYVSFTLVFTLIHNKLLNSIIRQEEKIYSIRDHRTIQILK